MSTMRIPPRQLVTRDEVPRPPTGCHLQRRDLQTATGNEGHAASRHQRLSTTISVLIDQVLKTSRLSSTLFFAPSPFSPHPFLPIIPFLSTPIATTTTPITHTTFKMKFAFAALVVAAAALLPAAEAMDISFSADKFARRADTKATDAKDAKAAPAPVAAAPKQRVPEFGIDLVNVYTKHNGRGMPVPHDVAYTYNDCMWKQCKEDGKWAWLDKQDVQCYLSPSYKFHAYSAAKNFDPEPSIERGACVDTANPVDFPSGIPEYTISVPYLYFNNLFDRRCKVRALVNVPENGDQPQHWVSAWVIEHNGGNWNTTGDTGVNGPQSGILLDTELYKKFVPKGEALPPVLSKNVEWFFTDINTHMQHAIAAECFNLAPLAAFISAAVSTHPRSQRVLVPHYDAVSGTFLRRRRLQGSYQRDD
ncbi:hypothetical protein PaG_02809 [Moesziomyces aphidis]|uniref:Uncharacterized protein n=1 Tax=Moesziomyces aphidis TaxID=84754 RepID=W3VND3_MOEAP|nr:hypothetical protein PaG_02809 [Moesziomyces aphidis]